MSGVKEEKKEEKKRKEEEGRGRKRKEAFSCTRVDSDGGYTRCNKVLTSRFEKKCRRSHQLGRRMLKLREMGASMN